MQLILAATSFYLAVAGATPDLSALIQQHVMQNVAVNPKKGKSMVVPGSHSRPIGQKVHIEGYENMVGKIVGYVGTEQYNILMEGQEQPFTGVDIGEIYDISSRDSGKAMVDPRFLARHGGEEAPPEAFETIKTGKPTIVSKGSQKNTWNVYVPGQGMFQDVQSQDVDTVGKPTRAPAAPVDPAAVAAALTPAVEVVSLAMRMKQEKAGAAAVKKALEADKKMLADKKDQEAAQEVQKVYMKEVSSEMAKTAKRKLGRRMASLDLSDQEKGFTVATQKMGRKGTMLTVSSIDKEGALAAWNQAHPLQAVTAGDRIVSVEGKDGDGEFLSTQLQTVLSKKLPTLRLVVEKPPMTKEDLSEVMSSAKLFMTKGAKGYLREALPFDIGKQIINEKENVAACSDISSSLLCSQSKEKFGLTCAGWTGSACVQSEEADCAGITTETICKDSAQKLGIPCAGWGGSSCLPINGSVNLITDVLTCNNAEKLLGIKAAGWGGESCLATTAECSEITLPGICNDASNKLGIACRGWGGNSCLGEHSKASEITLESACKHAKAKFGIDAAGWSGSACLTREEASCELIQEEEICQKANTKVGIACAGWNGEKCLTKEEAKCSVINEPSICKASSQRLGIQCAGWGGSSCLEVNAPSSEITSPSICAHSQQALGIESAGWSGTACLPAGPIGCGDITTPGVCHDSVNRLGISCGAWTGSSCTSPGNLKCEQISISNLCRRANSKFGLNCMWDGDSCSLNTTAVAASVAR